MPATDSSAAAATSANNLIDRDGVRSSTSAAGYLLVRCGSQTRNLAADVLLTCENDGCFHTVKSRRNP